MFVWYTSSEKKTTDVEIVRTYICTGKGTPTLINLRIDFAFVLWRLAVVFVPDCVDAG